MRPRALVPTTERAVEQKRFLRACGCAESSGSGDQQAVTLPLEKKHESNMDEEDDPDNEPNDNDSNEQVE